MAIVTGNPVLRNFSGVLGGNLVFRQYGNKTVVAVKSDRRRRRNSALQQMSCDKFKAASRYAREILKDTTKRDHYRKMAKKLGKHSAYNLIISEYMQCTKISIEGHAQTVKNDVKRIKFSVDKGGYTIKQVRVSVMRDGNIIGDSLAKNISGNHWVYAVRQKLEAGDILCVAATDSLTTYGYETPVNHKPAGGRYRTLDQIFHPLLPIRVHVIRFIGHYRTD